MVGWLLSTPEILIISNFNTIESKKKMKNRTVKAHFKNYCLGFFAKKFTKNVL